MSPNWRYFLPGYVLALPHTLLGLALAYFYGAHSFRWHDGALECLAPKERVLGHPGAQTHGFLTIFTYHSDWKAEQQTLNRDWPPLRVHERCHVVWALAIGPVYMVAYALCFLVMLPFKRFDWHAAYVAIPFERQAYKIEDQYAHGLDRGSWGERL